MGLNSSSDFSSRCSQNLTLFVILFAKDVSNKGIGFFYNGLVLDGAIHIVCRELLRIFYQNRLISYRMPIILASCEK
ncbi:MAG TPA: hypothetical protein DCZ48_04215 [Methylococcaceae bacterium]|nr:hypothetical protein [Methylococcaceae bacterium]